MNSKTADRIQEYCGSWELSVTKLIELKLHEKEKLRNMADKITKIPPTVRRYT